MSAGLGMGTQGRTGTGTYTFLRQTPGEAYMADGRPPSSCLALRLLSLCDLDLSEPPFPQL